MTYHRIFEKVTRRSLLADQELLTLSEFIPGLCGVRVAHL